MEQVAKIIAQVAVFVEMVNDKIGRYVQEMNAILSAINTILQNPAGNSVRALDRKLNEQYNKYYKIQQKAQDWVDGKIKTIEDWELDQIKKVQDQIKRQKAKEMVSAMECATKVQLPASAVNEMLKAIPDIPIPVPAIPRPKIPFPTLPSLSDLLAQLPTPALPNLPNGSLGSIAK